MRTTVDIDPDLLKRLRDEAHRTDVPVRQLLNTVLRLGLRLREEQKDPPYRMPTFPMGPPLVSEEQLIKANQLVAQLDDEEMLRKMRLFEEQSVAGR